MLLYIMLYIMLAYLMLFAALSNTVCLYDASFFSHLFLQMLFVFMLFLDLFKSNQMFYFSFLPKKKTKNKQKQQ